MILLKGSHFDRPPHHQHCRFPPRWPESARRLIVSETTISPSLETEFQLALETIRDRLEEQLSFEALLNEISARFINIPSHQVAATIEDTQRMLCERLELDRSSLFQTTSDPKEMMLLKHIYQRPGLPFPVEKRKEQGLLTESYWRHNPLSPAQEYSRFDAKQSYAWFYAKARAGETAIVPDVQTLPEPDRTVLSSFGTQSTVVVPLFVGGQWLGMLTFGAVRQG